MVEPPHDPPESTPPSQVSGGFSKLSQKMARRTTDLIGVAILAIGLLAVGSKIGRWWNTDPEEVAAPITPLPTRQPWDSEGLGVSLEWGELNYVIHHQIISGDAEVARERLEEIALGKSSHISTPTFEATKAEKKLLEELNDVAATRQLESGGELYRFNSHLPMVILTLPATPSPTNSPKTETHRVVCWGRAFPQSQNQWMVFLFYSAGAKSPPMAGNPTIPLPNGCRKVQRMQDASGQSWLGFRGAGSIEEGQRHFDHWFQDRDWRRLRGWSKTGSAWTVQFQSRETRQRSDIWLNVTTDGEWEGMIFLSPRELDPTKN